MAAAEILQLLGSKADETLFMMSDAYEQFSTACVGQIGERAYFMVRGWKDYVKLISWRIDFIKRMLAHNSIFAHDDHRSSFPRWS